MAIYLLELVRYLHLNPLRATVVPDLRTLTRYPWTGHSALLGTVPRPARPVPLAPLAARLARRLGVPIPALLGRTQTRAVVRARHLVAYVWVEQCGQTASTLARVLGQTRGNMSLAAKRGAAWTLAWQAAIRQWCRAGKR
jgi:hypothetical protein